MWHFMPLHVAQEEQGWDPEDDAEGWEPEDDAELLYCGVPLRDEPYNAAAPAPYTRGMPASPTLITGPVEPMSARPMSARCNRGIP